MWNELRIGDYQTKISPLKVERKTYPDVDKDGNPVTTTYLNDKGEEVSFPKRAHKNTAGTIVSKTFKSINGKVLDKFKRTKEVRTYIEVPDVEAYDLISEAHYVVDCELLRKYLVEKHKALKFVWTAGNGFKAYQTYVLPFRDALLMVCGWGQISNAINTAVTSKASKVEAVAEVERANPEELLLEATA